ncbi:MAG: translocation/assembly module TamB domain-containing protein [Beijerinckiaceae bacterium]|nr:translocation/assembly module TamB domain-containing protein [Beijerinckiaceae bacterium]
MQKLRSFALTLATLTLVAFAGIFPRAEAWAAEEDKGILADLISRALSTPSSTVSVGAVDGALSSDATIRDIVISDRDGPWLKVDKVRLIWTRSALLRRRLEVDRLEIGRLDILRRPAPPTAQAKAQVSDAPILPELPVKVEVKAFQLAELALGSTVTGVAAKVSATGSASLGSPAEGLDLTLEAKRLDAPGAFVTKLSYVPSTDALQTRLQANEPAGGIIAHLADIPGQPPVVLDIDGNGTLDAFLAKLSFNAGPEIGAQGTARLGRSGGGRRLALDLASRIEGLMPPVIAPVFAGTTKLDGVMTFGDDGSFDIETLTLLSSLARFEVAGRYGMDKSLEFRAVATALPNEDGKTKTGASELGKLAFLATITGPSASPTVNASLDIAAARLPFGGFDTLRAEVSAKPDGRLDDPDLHLSLLADGAVANLAFNDPGLAQAFNGGVSFNLRGITSADGATDFEKLTLGTAAGSFSWKGILGFKRVLGTAALHLPDLARFSTLTGRALSGSARLGADLAGDLSKRVGSAMLGGEAVSLKTGVPAFDGLSGNRLKLGGRIEALPDGSYAISKLALDGAHFSASIDGTANEDSADVTAMLDAPDLQRADARLSGRANGTARLFGPLTALNANTRLSIENAKALGRPIPSLTLEAAASDLQGALSLDATLGGIVDGKPAKGMLSARRLIDGGWHVAPLDISVGSVSLAGAVDLAASNLATGSMAFKAGNLDDLSPLVLARLGGHAEGSLMLDAAGGRQNVRLDLNGSRLVLPSTSIDRFAAHVAAENVSDAPILNAAISADKLIAGGQTISQLRFDAKGTSAASDFNLAAKAAGFDLASKGRLLPGAQMRVEIASFDARRDGRRISLAFPARLAIADGSVTIESLIVALDAGRLSVTGRAGSVLDLRLKAVAVPLSAARIFAPSLDLAGTLEAEAEIKGAPDAPTGPWKVKIANLATAETRSAGVGAIGIDAKGQLGGGRSSIDATIAIPRAGTLTLRGAVPLSATGSLDVTAQGRLDASIANASLAADGRSVGGSVAPDFRARGPLGAPQVTGSAALSKGSYSDALLGVQLKGVEARFLARGTEVTIEAASATTRNGGTLGASGRIRIDPAAGFPAMIRVTGQKAELMSSGFLTAVASLDISVSGPLLQRPNIGGKVAIETIEVNVADRLPTSVRPVAGIRHVNATGTVAKRLAEQKRIARAAAKRGRRAASFDAALALSVSAPSRVFVRGRGIDAELGGELRLAGTLSDPVVSGGFDLRRGRLNIIGQRLDFTRGRVTFTGAAIPALDFIAQTQASDVTAYINVSGTATEPVFAFTSQPDLPQDEVLSRILFAKASGSLSPFQALQLAQAAAQFSGVGDDAFESIRKSLGVDNLDVQFGANGPIVGVSRSIGNNISVGVKAGAKPEESGVSVNLDVTRRLRIQAEGGADGSAAIGVGTEIEY